MDLWQMAALAAVQGVSEFLPISSSGHLTLLEALFGLGEGALDVGVLLHVGTLLSVVLYFRRDLAAMLGRSRRLIVPIVVATIPAVIVVLLLGDWIELAFRSVLLVGFMLLITGLLLLGSHRFAPGNRGGLDGIGWRDGLWVGLFQAVAILPGISRSGSTISAGLLRGMDRPLAARFSFLVSVPALVGAACYEGLRLVRGSAGITLTPALAAAGLAISFAVGLASIHLLLRIIQRRGIAPFGYYCLGAGLLAILLGLR